METTIDNFDSSDDRRLHRRRGFSRASVQWPITILSKAKTLQGRVKNLSKGGVLVYLPEQLEVHESIRVAVEVTDCSDVLTAEGVVIRVTALDTLVDNEYAFSAAIQFTKISPEDLKFFSGNLAPEWHQKNSRPEPSSKPVTSRKTGNKKSYKLLGIAGAVLGLFLLLLYFTGADNEENNVAPQIAALDKQLTDMQLQLDALPNYENTLENIEKHIQLLDDQITGLKKEFTSISTLMENREKERSTPLNASPPGNSDGHTVLSNNPSSKNLVSPPPPPTPEFYEVKKGQTLYRISMEHGMSVNKLRELNNLSIDDTIHPGLKLRVK